MNTCRKKPVKPQIKIQLNHLKNEDSWCVSDFSLHSKDRIALSGSKHATRETFVKVFYFTQCKTDGQPKCLYFREFNRQDNPEKWRLVSFLDKLNLVTCFDNQVEKISMADDEIVQSKKLGITGASCISVQATKVFIGFSKSCSVVVLNSTLQQTNTITLNALQSGWPVDLMMVSDTLLVCSFGCTPRKALSLAEKDGQLLREYTNPQSDDSVPLSLTVSGDCDLVAILWNSPPQLTIHSFYHGHCLVIANIEPAERIRSIGQDKLVMVDERGEMKVFHIGQFFTMDNLKTTLSCLLSCDDCKDLGDFFGLSLDQTEQTDAGNSSSERVQNDQTPDAEKMDFFRCLEENSKICNGDVTDLMRACTQLNKGRTLLSPLEAYEKYGGSCESRLVIDSGPCGTRLDTERDEDERRGDGSGKRRHHNEITDACNKRKRIDRDVSEAVNESPANDVNQLELADSIKRAVKEAVEPLLGEIRSLKQQNDLMMCYLRTQPCQHSSPLHCSCFHQCQPPVVHPCSQFHTHTCRHAAPQTFANVPMQCGNGVPPNSQPNVYQHLQQQSLPPLPPQQPVVPHPQVFPYPQPPVPLQPYRQLPPPLPTHLQAVSNYHPPPPSNLLPPDHRQSTALTGSSAQSSGQQTYPPVVTSMQIPAQSHTGMISTFQPQGHHISSENGAASPSNDFSSPLTIQANMVPPQRNTQGTPTRQQSLEPLEATRLAGDPPHQFETTSSTASTPIQAPNQTEDSTFPDLSTEVVLSSGQGSSLPTKLSDLPRSVQLKLIPCEGQKSREDRQSVTKILLRYFFTHDERLVSNTTGKLGFRQLRRDKLFAMRDLIFKICPLDGEDSEWEREKEWRDLCKLIDVSNRRYRNVLKTGRSKKKMTKQAKS